VTVGWLKPHPIIFETALRESGAAAKDAVFIGDNWEADVDGPRRVGMSSIYVGIPSAQHPSVSLQEVPQAIRSLA
jgi:putative hydrolase of the HAD superfamily